MNAPENFRGIFYIALFFNVFVPDSDFLKAYHKTYIRYQPA